MNSVHSQLKEKFFDGRLLWRHRPDDQKNEYAIDELEEGYIYFSKPDELNDPYDCFFGLIKMKKDQQKMKKYFQKKYPWSNRKERRNQAKELVKTDGAKIIKEAHMRVAQQVGIASFTISCGNLMMWSHYSNFHKGICLGFNKIVDEDYFESFRVNYLKTDEEYEIYEYDPTDNEQFIKAMRHLVSTKSFLWGEEYEQRIIRQFHGKYKFPPRALEFVIIGSQAETQFENKVLTAISKNGMYDNLRVFKMLPSKQNVFGLDFNEIK